jgi:AcrR family transcriptional regulator
MKSETRSRILDAAQKALGGSGWTGATTQEIARLARVNEVTLFRHFRSKQALFEAVIARFLEGRRKVLDQAQSEDLPLREMLTRYAENYRRSHRDSGDLIRTFLAEYSRHPKALKQTIEEAARPLKEDLVTYLKTRQKRGEIRRDVDCAAFLDLFSGFLLADVVKPCVGKRRYSQATYHQLCIEVLLRGVSP